MRKWQSVLLIALIPALPAGCGGEEETSPQEESGVAASAEVPAGTGCQVVEKESGLEVEIVKVRGPLACSEARLAVNLDRTSSKARAEGIGKWLCSGPTGPARVWGTCTNVADNRKFKAVFVEGVPPAD
jgi:hypothetical protein